MECKSNIVKSDHSNIFELIDTLWNVNGAPGEKGIPGRRRINRYIMECKWRYLFLSLAYKYLN